RARGMAARRRRRGSGLGGPRQLLRRRRQRDAQHPRRAGAAPRQPEARPQAAEADADRPARDRARPAVRGHPDGARDAARPREGAPARGEGRAAAVLRRPVDARGRGDGRQLAADGRARLAVRALLAAGPHQRQAGARWVMAMSDGAREQRLRDLFDRAVALSPPERDALLATVDDEVLRERLRALLVQDAHGTASVLKAPTAAIELLRRVGDYELLRELGRGGMGVVWLARQVEPVERLVALKMVRADDGPAIVERFEQERQTLALMNHPGIARLFDGGTSGDGT